MTCVTNVAISLVAALHIYFLVLEMFLWDKPLGRKTFGFSLEHAKSTKVLAANQGLYNGFLAAGLIWSLYLGDDGTPVKIFFLTCILIAGVFGAFTVSKKIFLVQALPAGVALILVITLLLA